MHLSPTSKLGYLSFKNVNEVLYSSQLNNCVFEQIIGQRKMNRLKT